MKKTLLLIFVIALSSQIASAQYFINELFVSPPGTDAPNEFIELRGPVNGVFPAGTYLVQIEGDLEGGNNPGDVESNSETTAGLPQGGIIDLSGVALGTNGILVIVSTGNDYTIDAAATQLIDVTDGDLEDKSHTFMLISAPVAPTSDDDIDSDDDGTPDGDVFASWTVYDSISFADDDGAERVYGAVVIIKTNANGTAFPSGTVVVETGADEYDYVARINNNNGTTVTNDAATSDFLTGDVNSRNAERTQYQFSSTDTRVIPSSFAGEVIENTIGALNFGQQPLTASTASFAFSSLSIYPNPAVSLINVISNGPEAITGAEIFDVLGKKVMVKQDWNSNQIDVDSLSSGVYFLKVFSNENSITRKIVIQ